MSLKSLRRVFPPWVGAVAFVGVLGWAVLLAGGDTLLFGTLEEAAQSHALGGESAPADAEPLAVVEAASPAPPVLPGTPQELLEQGYERVVALLKQPKSAARDAEIDALLAGMIDYDAMIRSVFRDHWAKDLTADQRREAQDGFHELITRNTRCHLAKILPLEVTYAGTELLAGGWKARLHATNPKNRKEPPVLTEYLMKEEAGGKLWIVDIITEHSSLVRNYGDQIDMMLTREDFGFGYLMKRIQRKIASTTC